MVRYKSWTSFLYFERNTKLINQGNYVNIVYFDFCKATNKTKKTTRLELEMSRWMKTISKEWWLTELVISKKMLNANVQRLHIWPVLLIYLWITWLIAIKSVGNLKLGRKFNILYGRTKISSKCWKMYPNEITKNRTMINVNFSFEV